jgi:hypothetical protein
MFSAPHKALRRTMSSFSVLSEQTNFSDVEAVEKLKNLGKEMFFLLTSHSEMEDKVILSALEAKLPGASEHDKLDHIKIELVRQQIENQLEKLDTTNSPNVAYDFYLRFAAFHSQYLEHTNEEETVTQQAIWDHLTVEEQMSVNKAVLKRMDLKSYALWLKHIIPAQNETENLRMFVAISKNLPASDFDSLLGTLKQMMPENEFTKLKSNLWITSMNH